MIRKIHYNNVCESFKSIDWSVLIFLLLLLNIKLVIKPGAVVLTCFLQFNFESGFRLRNFRPSLFYLMIIGIGIFNCLITVGFTNINYNFGFLTGICFWLISIIPVHRFKIITPVKEIMFTFVPANPEELPMDQFHIFGSASVNESLHHQFRKLAVKNTHFTDHLPREELIRHYQQEKMHVLPGWLETCGLSTLKALIMCCNLAITSKGFVGSYFKDCAFIVLLPLPLRTENDR